MITKKKKVRMFCALVMAVALYVQQIPYTKVAAADAGEVWDGSIASDYDGGNGTSGSPYLIDNGAQLARLASEVNSGREAGSYYLLTSDINLGGIEWTPIGNGSAPFSGNFDGGSCVISNLYIGGGSSVSRIQNNAADYDTQHSGSVSANDIASGSVSGNDITSRSVSGNDITSRSASGSDITFNSVSGNDITSHSIGAKDITSASVSGNDINSDSVSTNDIYYDSIVIEDTNSNGSSTPIIEPGDLSKVFASQQSLEASPLDEIMQSEIDNILAEVEAAASETEEAGTDEYVDPDKLEEMEEEIERIEELAESQPFGQAQTQNRRSGYSVLQESTDTFVGLFGCISSGSITNTGIVKSEIYGGIYTGGIVGYTAPGTQIQYCYYDGIIDSNNAGTIGGIAGYADGQITYCYNHGTLGTLSSNVAYIGGIVGLSTEYIVNCNNIGEVSGSETYIGGIVGYYNTNKMIKTCFNNGSITSTQGNTRFVAGIAGYAKDGIIKDCANHGTITGSASSGFASGLSGAINIITTSYNTGDVSGYYSSGLSGVIYGASLRNYTAGTISGSQNAAITSLLAANATIGNATTYWRMFSASRAIYSSANSNGGSPYVVLEATLKSDSWIQNTLLTPFIPDTPNYNMGYPIHRDIDYNLSFEKDKTITGTFSFSSYRSEENTLQQEEDYTAVYYYSDNYFLQEASVYNQSLATMSLCLEMSAFGSNEGGKSNYTNKYSNAEQLLLDIGYEDIEANEDYTIKPEKNTFGVIIAHKEIEVRGTKKTVIALATRGGGYEKEWGANFEVGATGNHHGFEAASQKAYECLEDYIDEYGANFEDEIVLWLVGYSRAAAATNLLAGRLTAEEEIAGITFDSQDVYAYCFATPMGRLLPTSDTVSYANIHNIINPCDFVTKVAPANWEFGRYGVDEPVIPAGMTVDNQEYYDAMIGKFEGLGTEWVEESLLRQGNNRIHVLNTFQAKQLVFSEVHEGGVVTFVFNIVDNDRTMSEFLDSLIRSVAVGAVDRENYTQYLQSAVSTLAAELLGGGADKEKWETVPAYAADIIADNIVEIIYAYCRQGYEGAEPMIYECIHEAIIEAGIDLDSINYEGINPTTFSAIIDTVIGLVFDSLITNGIDDFVTLFNNASGLETAHYPELYFSWLQTQDPNYKGAPMFFASSYRIVRINSDVDVNVYDSAGTLAAQFIEDVPQETLNSNVTASLNAEGEKVLRLPSSESYDIRFTARSGGMLDYSIGEYSYYTGAQTKLVSYYDVQVTEGDVIEGIIPEFAPEDTLMANESSSVDYTLTKGVGDLTPTREFQGEEAKKAFHTVTPVSDNPEYGNAIGGGVYSEGAYTLVCAVPYENHEFIGWYEDGNLISTESIYQFRVEQDTVIKAVFR